MKTQFIILLTFCMFWKCAADDRTEKALLLAEQYYNRLAGRLAPTNVPFSDVYRRPFDVPPGEIDIRENVYGERVWVQGQFSIGAYLKTGQLSTFSNRRLYKYIQTNETQNVPALSTDQAYLRARQSLNVLGVSLDKRAILTTLSFGDDDCRSVWRVAWEPSDGGYRYDDFLKDIYNPHVSICFSEKYDFVFFTSAKFPPPPKTTEVRVQRETAIFKAEQAVPLVMLTPYYRQCRLPGFKVSGVKSAELRIACPNWLLNPARAIWIWDSPPKETRLCWIVRFTTVDTVKREEGMKPAPPDILIYVDAATGEIVGANFT